MFRDHYVLLVLPQDLWLVYFPKLSRDEDDIPRAVRLPPDSLPFTLNIPLQRSLFFNSGNMGLGVTSVKRLRNASTLWNHDFVFISIHIKDRISIFYSLHWRFFFSVVVNANVINCDKLLHLIMVVVKCALNTVDTHISTAKVEFWVKSGGHQVHFKMDVLSWKTPSHETGFSGTFSFPSIPRAHQIKNQYRALKYWSIMRKAAQDTNSGYI